MISLFLRLKEERQKYSANYLHQRGFYFIYCELAGKRGLVYSSNHVLLDEVSQNRFVNASLETIKRVSLMEQDMRLRQGRPIGSTCKVTQNYHMKILDIGLLNQAVPLYCWEVI